MAELLVLTLFAAIAAIYQILPAHRQLRIRYNLWTKVRLGFMGAMFLVIVFTYALSFLVQSKEENTLETVVFSQNVTITPLEVEFVQLIAVLLIIIPITVVFAKPNVKVRNENNLLEILRDLYNQEQYPALINVIQDNYTPLIDRPKKPLSREPQMEMPFDAGELRSELDNEDGGEESDDSKEEDMMGSITEWFENQVGRSQQLLPSIRHTLARFRYWRANQAEEAADYTEHLLLDPNFSDLYLDLASELGLKILRDGSLEKFPRKEVVNQYLRTQLRAENTLLHRELARNVEMKDLHQYKIAEENRIVYGLFSDFDCAEDLDVYQPIGNEIEEILRDQRREDFDKYNDRRLSDTRFQDNYVYRDPVFAGIQFFDVLVRAAFDQEVDWHVWLSAYESFTREICENYEINEYSDPSAEWPNDYSRFLYEMVSNMRDWIRMMEDELRPDVDDGPNGPPYKLDLDPEPDEGGAEKDARSDGGTDDGGETPGADDDDDLSEPPRVAPHVNLGPLSTMRMNRNIPEMTSIVLFSCHEEILSTDEIPIQFMSYVTDIIFRTILDLREYEEGSLQWWYSEFMLKCLEENIAGRNSDPTYCKNLKRVYRGYYGDSYDYGVRHELLVKDTEMTGLTDELDNLIGS